jgi:hypothetical protein
MSAFNTPWFNSQDNNFFNHLNKSKIAHLALTAETEDFDEEVTKQWREEGFDTVYIPLLNGGNDYINRVHSAGDSFGAGEYYGIVGKCPLLRECTKIDHSDINSVWRCRKFDPRGTHEAQPSEALCDCCILPFYNPVGSYKIPT